MSVTLPRTLLLAGLLSPSLSWALGLGEIHLNSSLNEPMNAEIDLIAAAPEELTALRAALAGRDAFTRYGIDKPAFLNSLTFKVGKSKDGRDVLMVHSTEAIPEPFVTFLVEVNWARGRLMREYTVLLDPPVYTPGEAAHAAAPVTAPSTATPSTSASTGGASAAGASRRTGGRRSSQPVESASNSDTEATAPGDAAGVTGGGTYTVAKGDSLSKIARSLHAETPTAVDKTMIALYRANPDAFGGNINILKRGAVLRVPDADAVAALNQREAMNEVHRQMDAWRTTGSVDGGSHLRLVSPSASGSGSGSSAGSKPGAGSDVNGAEAQALRDRVRDLEGQVADTHRQLEIKNTELAQLQHQLGQKPTASAPVPPAVVEPVKPPVATVPPPKTTEPAASAATPPASAVVPPPVVVTPPVKKPAVAPAPPADSGSWIDWVAANWWLPAAVLAALLAGLGFAAWRKRRAQGDEFPGLDSTDVADFRDPTARLGSNRKGSDSFVVEESGEHQAPDFGAEPEFGDAVAAKSPDDTISSESAVNLDQGDPMAEADFHMAYGLYDQAADLVRIALEREPERRDLRMKLLEIYFVWGNKDAFLQTAKGLEQTRDRAPVGEWDKIVIMGKQICPDEPMFAHSTGSGRGSGAPIDLNLEGGENRVDIDLFGEPGGEHGLDHALADEDHLATTGENPGMLGADSGLDFTLDAPERGADDSPTREMAPAPRDEPTVESELMNFMDAPTQESASLKTAEMRGRVATRLDSLGTDQTAEVSLDDLGLDLDQLEQTGAPSIAHLEETDHPADAPTMLAGLDARSRKMMADAAANAHDHDLTELERELEASFVADLEPEHEEIKTTVLGPESAPTVLMPREVDVSETSRFKSPEFSDISEADKVDVDSTSKLRGLNADSIDLDLDRLATALGSGDTIDQPRQVEDVFSSEVFDATTRNKAVDLDVGEPLNGSTDGTNRMSAQTNRLKSVDLAIPELEPVTMSEVGTKLDLARAYMDMGDPEGARSILDEVVQEGSASQKQEASRLIESLPG